MTILLGEVVTAESLETALVLVDLSELIGVTTLVLGVFTADSLDTGLVLVDLSEPLEVTTLLFGVVTADSLEPGLLLVGFPEPLDVTPLLFMVVMTDSLPVLEEAGVFDFLLVTDVPLDDPRGLDDIGVLDLTDVTADPLLLGVTLPDSLEGLDFVFVTLSD